jgi:hypothetical protein
MQSPAQNLVLPSTPYAGHGRVSADEPLQRGREYS